MATISAKFGELLGLPEPSARFLLALFSTYPLALVYRVFFAESSSKTKNLFFTATGIGVMYYVYGFTIWHSMLDVAVVYLVLYMFGGSLFSVVLTWIITMGHLVGGYTWLMYQKQVHPISWTIPHCVLVLKLIGLSYNLYDGKKAPERLSVDQKKFALDKVPSFTDITGYSFFFGSELVGPQLPFSRHLAFTEGRLFNWKETSSSIPAGLQRMVTGIFFALLFSVLNQYFPIAKLISDPFLDKSFPEKLFLVFICGKVALWRYISVWLIAEGSCILTGISYEGKDEKGRTTWQALANIYIIKFETCITLEGVINSFNLNTNKWVSWYVYKRLKFLGSKMASWVVTMVFVSLWHGVWPGYYINFSIEMIGVMAERTFISFLRRLLGTSLSDFSLAARIPLTVAAYFLKNCLLMYPMTAFMLLKWEDCYKFMSSVHFYCHVLLVGWLVLYYALFRSLVKRSKLTKTE